jgi:hypothetical protein
MIQLTQFAGAFVALAFLGISSNAGATLAQSQVFPDWTPFASGADVTLSADTSNKHSGNQSLKFVNLTSTSPNNGGFFQTVPVQPSTLYHLSAWVMGSNIATGVTDCFGLDQNFATLVCIPSGTYGWQQISWNYTTPANETTMAFALYSVNTGTAWFDDISIVQNGTSTNLAANAGFETSHDSITLTSPDQTIFSVGGTWLQVTSTAPTVNWVAGDINGVQVGSGSVSTASGPNILVSPNVGPGWYSLHLTTPSGGVADSTFSVVTNSWINNSAKPNPFGSNLHPWAWSNGQIDAIGAGGLASMRIDLRWELVEKTAGVYTFDPAEDQLLGYLMGGGVKPLLTMGYSNPFYDGGHVPSSASGIAAFAAYATAAAQHYGTRVDYDVFNEFNVAGTNDSACGTTADCYYALLGPAANAIHAAAPGARVVGPTLGGFTQDWLGTTPDSYNWLKRFLDIGGLAYVDVVDIHNYTFPVVTPPEGNNEAVISAVRSLLATYSGGASMPLWLTETGWPPFPGIATELQQAQWVVRDAALALRAGLAQYMYYDLIDDCADPSNGNCRFGLLHDAAEAAGVVAPKPGFTAYAVLARSLAGYSYASSDSWGSGVYSLVFSNGTANRRVAWAPAANTTLAVHSTSAVTVTNWDGSGSTITPTAGVVTFSVGPDPVYVDGSGITSGGVAATPAFTAAPTGSVTHNVAVPIAVAVNGAAAGAATGTITFRSAYGSTSVSAVAGSTVSGTLTLSAFPSAGIVTVPIEVVQGSTVIGRLVLTLNVN